MIEIKDREYKLKLEEARIRNERNALNADKIPKWSSQKIDTIERQIQSVSVKVDIKNLVEDVMKCVAIAAGNLAAIPSLVSGLDASLNLCWSNSQTTSYYSDIIQDEKGHQIYVRFDYKKIDEDLRAISYKLLVENFNKKYKNLTTEQKELLREYINNINNTGKLNLYVSGEATKLATALKEVGSKISDKVTKIKLAETISNIKKIKSTKRIKEEHLSALMMTYELLKELKDKTK